VPVGGLVQHSRPVAVQLGGAPAEDLEQQGVLGAEMVVDAGQVDPGLGGDVAHRDVLEAVEGEEPLGGGEHLGLGGGFALGIRIEGGSGDGLGHDSLCLQRFIGAGVLET